MGMESQDGESANEVPVVRNYKHKETRNTRFTNPVFQSLFETTSEAFLQLCQQDANAIWRCKMTHLLSWRPPRYRQEPEKIRFRKLPKKGD